MTSVNIVKYNYCIDRNIVKYDTDVRIILKKKNTIKIVIICDQIILESAMYVHSYLETIFLLRTYRRKSIH